VLNCKIHWASLCTTAAIEHRWLILSLSCMILIQRSLNTYNLKCSQCVISNTIASRSYDFVLKSNWLLCYRIFVSVNELMSDY